MLLWCTRAIVGTWWVQSRKRRKVGLRRAGLVEGEERVWWREKGNPRHTLVR